MQISLQRSVTYRYWLLLASLFLCATLIPIPLLAEDKPSIRVKDTPPAGFEDLVLPQTTEVDVYYGNEKMGSTLATYTPDSIELTYPEEVALLIPYLINTETISQSLSGKLDTNASAVCLSELQRECGIIEPNIAGVIFDESRFHLYVFVNKLQLQPQGIVSNKFLPKVTATKFSTVNAFSSSFSGEDGNTSYTTGANHIISHGQSRMRTQWDYSDARDFNLENLSLLNDNSGIAKELGYYNSDTQFSSFTNTLDVLGARLYGSTRTRSDLDYSQATEIFLFLNSRSQVEVFREDKLIDGGIYDTGNQQLNTLRLPSGSYPITLRITDSSGSTREEQYFFVKSSILAPMDQPLHYFEVGLLEKDNSDDSLPEISNSELIRVGTAYRLKNNLGASAEVLHSKDNSLLQGGIAYFGPGYILQNSALIGADGEWGLQMSGQIRYKDISINMDFRQVESNIDDDIEDIDVRILPSDFTQGNISASVPFSKGNLIARTQYRDRLNEDSSTSYGLEYRYPLFHRNHYSIDANFSSFFEEDDYNLQAGLRISRIEARQNLSLRPRYLFSKSDGETDEGPVVFANLSKSYEDTDYGEITVSSFFSEELDRSTAGIRGENLSSLGRIDTQIEHVDDSERGSFLRYRGNQNTNILTNNGQLAFGGQRNTDSGVILELQGPTTNEPFEIFVDGQPRGTAKIGKRTVLPLAAFKTYRISIRSISDEILHFDEGPRSVTLYPGNVETLNYQVEPITVLITRIELANGSPAARMKIKNAIGYAVTDQDGWLQAEISGKEALELTKNGNTICHIKLPELEINQGVAFIDKLVCEN
ncbi:MAG: TcfC E-set like domain-containing protein [Gammaproteobacteria bacterium]